MIINLDEEHTVDLRSLGAYALVDGSFDPIHHGHIAYFNEASKFKIPVVCLIAPDSYTAKKHKVMLPAPKRALVIESFIQISVVAYGELSTGNALLRLRPKIYFKGGDWAGQLPGEILEICEEIGCGVAFGASPIASSSQLLASIQS